MVSQLDISSLAQIVRMSEQNSFPLMDLLIGKSDQGRMNWLLRPPQDRLQKGDWVMIPPYEGPCK